MDRQPAVYILTNVFMGTLYIGVTSNLIGRVWQHRNDAVEGFTRDYQLHRLVWFERYEDMYTAISREKQLKKWNRAWKVELITASNPTWRDPWNEIVGVPDGSPRARG